MKAHGTVFKYGDNVDTDVIIPARYLNSSEPAELASHCMEDLDAEFIKKVKNYISGKKQNMDISDAAHPESMRRLQLRRRESDA